MNRFMIAYLRLIMYSVIFIFTLQDVIYDAKLSLHGQVQSNGRWL